jgi:hypothetical protein
MGCAGFLSLALAGQDGGDPYVFAVSMGGGRGGTYTFQLVSRLEAGAGAGADAGAGAGAGADAGADADAGAWAGVGAGAGAGAGAGGE